MGELTDLLGIMGTGMGLYYAIKGLVFYLKHHKSEEGPTRMDKLYVLLPPPLDALYFLCP